MKVETEILITRDGKPKWIEVKSTTGTDGYFEWPRREFEMALRKGPSYEIWRVYQIGSPTPVIKIFANPADLLRTGEIVIDLASVRAQVEGMIW